MSGSGGGGSLCRVLGVGEGVGVRGGGHCHISLLCSEEMLAKVDTLRKSNKEMERNRRVVSVFTCTHLTCTHLTSHVLTSHVLTYTDIVPQAYTIFFFFTFQVTADLEESQLEVQKLTRQQKKLQQTVQGLEGGDESNEECQKTE